MSIVSQELKELVAFAKANGVKSVTIRDISVEFFEKEKPDIVPLNAATFELPKEAQPPTGDALLFWSSEPTPEEEEPKQGA